MPIKTIHIRPLHTVRGGTSIGNKDDFITAMMCMNVLATEYVMTYDMVGAINLHCVVYTCKKPLAQ